ncbi:hypothetical protein QT711_19320 [Sporosarcina saromensis]|uniref:Lipoprotein n=1 Tax=Sporosarcina saromensis TaxID=359365 RepID=A0ABU4GEA0_9BACL|nr:hypothetical protein [Sporosarcina saromensis]
MRRIVFISFLVMFLLLMSACSTEKTKEVPSPSEESLEESGYTGMPPTPGVTVNNDVASIRRDRSCWEKPDKKCNIVHVEDFSSLLSGTRTMRVTPGEEILFSLPTNPGVPNELRGLDNIEIDLIQFFKGEESYVEHDGKSFNAPQEPGKYYYSAVVKWIGDIKGEASYAFSILVK